MNSLSWLIYLGDVVNNVGGFLITFSIVGVIGGLMVLGFSSMARSDRAMEAETYKKVGVWCKKVIITGVIFGFISTVIPSRSTIYLIAASESAQVVANNPDAQKIMKSTMNVINLELQKTAGDLAKAVTSKN